MLKLATWNVNSLKIRLDQVLQWFQDNAIDILAIQETKVTDENFPSAIFTQNNLHVSFIGQKSYNGVAIISRYPLHDTQTTVPDLHHDTQRRILITTICNIRLINLYVPNGSEVNSEKYHYKLNWLAKITNYIQQQYMHYKNIAIVGDFNIAPTDQDVYNLEKWQNCVLVSDHERAAYQNLLNLGFIDSFRQLYSTIQEYSWWDYRAASFKRNHGLRIDHILLSTALMPYCNQVIIDKNERDHERPSDHAPVIAFLQHEF